MSIEKRTPKLKCNFPQRFQKNVENLVKLKKKPSLRKVLRGELPAPKLYKVRRLRRRQTCIQTSGHRIG